MKAVRAIAFDDECLGRFAGADRREQDVAPLFPSDPAAAVFAGGERRKTGRLRPGGPQLPVRDVERIGDGHVEGVRDLLRGSDVDVVRLRELRSESSTSDVTFSFSVEG